VSDFAHECWRVVVSAERDPQTGGTRFRWEVVWQIGDWDDAYLRRGRVDGWASTFSEAWTEGQRVKAQLDRDQPNGP
jgi:hypothetical protein